MRDYSEVVKKNLHISKHKTLKDALYEALKTTIVLGEIPANERINELELSNSLNVSRTPIRYALNKLADEHLLEYTKDIGMVVRGFSRKSAIEVFKIRIALETLASTEAMKKMTPEDFDELEGILLLGERLNDSGETDELIASFSAFNRFIFEQADMPRMTQIVTSLKDYLDYFRDLSMRSEERKDDALREHWLIYRGMKNQDKDQVALIIEEHLTRSERFILLEMERQNIE